MTHTLLCWKRTVHSHFGYAHTTWRKEKTKWECGNGAKTLKTRGPGHQSASYKRHCPISAEHLAPDFAIEVSQHCYQTLVEVILLQVKKPPRCESVRDVPQKFLCTLNISQQFAKFALQYWILCNHRNHVIRSGKLHYLHSMWILGTYGSVLTER